MSKLSNQFKISLNAICVLAGLLGVGLPATAETYTPVRSEDARAAIGITTHVNYLDTSYANLPGVLTSLKYLGINHVRELVPMPWLQGAAPLGYYQQIMDAGIEINFVVLGGKVDLDKALGPVAQLAAKSPHMISSVEGFNEVDHGPVEFDGLTGEAGAIAAQKALFAKVRALPALAKTPVYDLTGIMPLPVSLAGRADFGNAHLYPQNGYPPDGWFRGMMDLAKPNKLPMVVTEFGYASMPEQGWLVIGVGEEGQAKGILSGIMSGVENGFERTYLYELFDEKPDPQNADREQHFGMFNSSLQKKPSAEAIHNLTTLLGDQGSKARSFVPTPIDFDMKGLPEKSHVVVLQKSDNTYLVALWSEQVVWDHVKKAPIATKAYQALLKSAKTIKSAQIHDPLTGQVSKVTPVNGGELAVSVPDHPVVVEIHF
jgi:hypothetical protein